MIWSMKTVDGGGQGDEEDTGGGSGNARAVEWRRRRCQSTVTTSGALSKWIATTMFVFFFITGTAAVLSNSTFKGTDFVFILI